MTLRSVKTRRARKTRRTRRNRRTRNIRATKRTRRGNRRRYQRKSRRLTSHYGGSLIAGNPTPDQLTDCIVCNGDVIRDAMRKCLFQYDIKRSEIEELSYEFIPAIISRSNKYWNDHYRVILKIHPCSNGETLLEIIKNVGTDPRPALKPEPKGYLEPEPEVDLEPEPEVDLALTTSPMIILEGPLLVEFGNKRTLSPDIVHDGPFTMVWASVSFTEGSAGVVSDSTGSIGGWRLTLTHPDPRNIPRNWGGEDTDGGRSLHLVGCTVKSTHNPRDGNPYCIRVEDGSKNPIDRKKILLSAPTEDIQKQWIDTLNKAIDESARDFINSGNDIYGQLQVKLEPVESSAVTKWCEQFDPDPNSEVLVEDGKNATIKSYLRTDDKYVKYVPSSVKLTKNRSMGWNLYFTLKFGYLYHSDKLRQPLRDVFFKIDPDYVIRVGNMYQKTNAYDLFNETVVRISKMRNRNRNPPDHFPSFKYAEGTCPTCDNKRTVERTDTEQTDPHTELTATGAVNVPAESMEVTTVRPCPKCKMYRCFPYI